MKTQQAKLSLYFAWIISLLSIFGSLYFSEVLHLPPCTLCWYQRIFMYPLVVILAVGILRRDKNVPFYVLPLSVIGFLVASYHNLLYYGVIPESAAPCALGVSCTTRQIELFGFVTIPFLSLLSFAIITALMIFFVRSQRKAR